MLNVDKISKKFDKFNLKNVEFSVSEGEYFVLLGPSGSGKSLILELIAGLQKCDSGKIYINSVDITNQKIQKRKVGILFQDNALFPHLNVFENIAYPLNSKSITITKKTEIVSELANKLEITDLLKRKPATLSGGEKQRVALARALALEPSLLLLDEPLSSLDVMLKTEVRALFRNINKSGQTIIHVTHDYEDAITLASKVGIINNGILEHCGSPSEIFLKPKSPFIALLTGIKNFFAVNIINVNKSTFAIVSENINIKLSSEVQSNKGWIVVRSEDIVISNDYHEFSSNNQFKGIITEMVPTVNGIEVIIDIGQKWAALVTNDSVVRLKLEINNNVWISFKTVAVTFIPK
jgi:molybdate/tungstate transport system ATP-binding protein